MPHTGPLAPQAAFLSGLFSTRKGVSWRDSRVLTVVRARVPQGSGAEGALTPEEDPIQIWVTVRSRSGREPGPPTSGELTGWDGALGRAAHRSYGETEARGGRRDAPGSLSSPPLGRPLSLSTHSPLSGPHASGLPDRRKVAREKDSPGRKGSGTSGRRWLELEPASEAHGLGPEYAAPALPTERPARLPITVHLRQSRRASPVCRRHFPGAARQRVPGGGSNRESF